MSDSNPLQASRVLVYGVTGSGKTTLAAKISDRSGIPWHSVDDLTYRQNWTQVPDDEQRQIIASICEGSDWILDSAYGKWLDIPLSRAEVIVALDYPRSVSLLRLVRRTIARVVDRRPICNGNRETLRQAFSRDSIIVWHFRSFDRKRSRIREWADRSEGPRVIRFTQPEQAERWLNDHWPNMEGPSG